MTTPAPEIRQIVETLRLDACARGDVITIPYSPTGSWKTLGQVILDKIKPLAKSGRVQIKYRTQGDPRATVRKYDLSGDLQVKRIDLEAERATAEHAGVTYDAPQGGDPKELLAEALEAEPLLLPDNGSIGMIALLHDLSRQAKR